MPRKEKEYAYHFIYKTTNIKNGKFYIGMHSTNNLNDGYLGSGKRLRNSIRKHGKEFHIREIIEYADTRKDLIEKEMLIVTEKLISDTNCMNIVPGGRGNFERKYIEGPIHLNISSLGGKNMALRQKSDPVLSEKMRLIRSNSFKKMHANGNFNYKTFTGKSHSEEAKNRIGQKNSINQKGEKNSQFGSAWVTKEGIDKKIRNEDIEKYLLDGWQRGRNKKLGL